MNDPALPEQPIEATILSAFRDAGLPIGEAPIRSSIREWTESLPAIRHWTGGRADIPDDPSERSALLRVLGGWYANARQLHLFLESHSGVLRRRLPQDPRVGVLDDTLGELRAGLDALHPVLETLRPRQARTSGRGVFRAVVIGGHILRALLGR